MVVTNESFKLYKWNKYSYVSGKWSIRIRLYSCKTYKCLSIIIVKIPHEPYYYLNKVLPRKFVLSLLVKYLVRSTEHHYKFELGLANAKERDVNFYFWL